jgi:hypothetical protein
MLYCLFSLLPELALGRHKLDANKEHVIRILGCISVLVLLACSVAGQDSKVTKVTEDWVYLQNADLRVGLLRSHGGAIAHLSPPASDSNTLNHYDHGRLVQQSYYGDEDGSRWVDQAWRYNPVQGGDYKGNAAKVIHFQSTESTAQVKTIPRHWASGALVDECRMEQQLELDGPILRVHYRFSYHGNLTHKARHQETPAVFVAPRLSTLVTYTGDKPWTSAALTQRTPGWPNESVTLSEGWAAYVDENGVGIGVYVPGTTEATCYRFKGGFGSDCSYIAPLRTFSLTPDLSFSYVAFFTLGQVDTIRERFANIHRSLANPMAIPPP